MIAEISQSRFFTNRKIFICNTNVILQYSNFTKFNEISIPYETIAAHKENYITQIKYLRIFMRVLLYLVSITFFLRNTTEYLSNVYIYCTAAFIGLIAHHYITREKVWKIKLENNTYIILNKKLPDETTVNDFIEILFEQRNQYLRETYLFISSNMPYQPQFQNLQWLRKIAVIDGLEFEQWRKDLNALFSTEKQSIGFFNN